MLKRRLSIFSQLQKSPNRSNTFYNQLVLFLIETDRVKFIAHLVSSLIFIDSDLCKLLMADAYYEDEVDYILSELEDHDAERRELEKIANDCLRELQAERDANQ